MIIPKPTTHKIIDSDTVRLFFERDQARNFYMRGAVAWPEGKKEGFALIAGQATDTKEVWLFDEFAFMTVDHWFNQDQALKREGLVTFLLKCWAQYGCHTFFYSQDAELHRRYLLQCLDSAMIQPKPELIRTMYTEDEKIRDNIVQEYLALGRLKGDKNSQLYQHMTTSAMDEPLGKHVLRCLLAGYEANPWIDVTRP